MELSSKKKELILSKLLKEPFVFSNEITNRKKEEILLKLRRRVKR